MGFIFVFLQQSETVLRTISIYLKGFHAVISADKYKYEFIKIGLIAKGNNLLYTTEKYQHFKPVKASQQKHKPLQLFACFFMRVCVVG